MARIVYSALVESIKGSIGGTTFQKNAYGYTVKKKPNMINPNTQYQRVQKILFSQASKAWAGLSSAQRSDWAAWASAYPSYSKHNPSSELSGFAVFVRVHVYRFMCGLAVITAPAYTSYSQLNYNWDLWQDVAALHLNDADSLGTGQWYNLCFASRKYTPTQFFIGTAPRFVGYSLDSTDDINIYTRYVQIFGANLAASDQVSIKIVSIGLANGQVLAADKFLITAQEE
jgi:hypothetical protein